MRPSLISGLRFEGQLPWLRGFILCLALLLGAGCSKAGHHSPEGSLVVAIDSDMSVPGDIDRVQAQVRVAGELRHDEVFLIAPSGEDLLPITLTLLAADIADEPAEISVVGLKGEEPRVFAQAIADVPNDRDALLRLPLQWLCDGSAELNGDTFRSSCETAGDEPLTCRAGACVSPVQDADDLPNYRPADVFGGGDSPEDPNATCFNTEDCFDHSLPLVPNADCVVQVPFDAEELPSLGLSLPAGSGICGEAGCYIPLDKSKLFGWSVLSEAPASEGSNTDVQLPAEVCAQLESGDARDLLMSLVCPAKTPRVPTCGVWSSINRSITIGVLPSEPAPEADAGPEAPDAAPPITVVSPDAGTAEPTESDVVAAADAGSVAPSDGDAGVDEGVTVVLVRNELNRIEVTPDDTTLTVGDSLQLTALGIYTDGSSEELTSSVIWSSSASEYLSVDDQGRLTALAPGQAQVHAEFDSLSGSANVTIEAAESAPVLLTGLSVSPPSAEVPVGLATALQATASYSDGSSQDVSAEVTWSSDNETTASVDATGSVSALSTGQAVITASLESLHSSAAITVSDAQLVALSITPEQGTAPIGNTVAFSALGLYSDDTTRDVTSDATWASSAPEIAAISASNGGGAGQVIANAAGEVEIYAEFGGFSAAATFTVTDAVLVELSIDPSQGTLPDGTSAQFFALASYSDGSTVDVSAQAQWSSDSPLIASVGSTGVVQGNALGAAQISAEWSGQNASAQVSVTQAVLRSLEIQPDQVSVPVGSSTALVARGTFSDGTIQVVTATWTSDDTQIATVSAAGVVLGVAADDVIVRAQAGGLSATANVTVTLIQLVSVSVAPSSSLLRRGESVQLSATASYDDGTTQDVSSAGQWSATASLLEVSPAGLAHAIGEGVGTVSFLFQGQTASASITVRGLAVQALRINPSSATIIVGQQLQLQALATLVDGRDLDVTSSASWTTSSARFVVSAGLVAGGVAGLTTTIRASLSTVAAEASVTAQVIERITVTPSPVALTARQPTASLTVTLTRANGEQSDVTRESAFRADDDKVVQVSAAGALRAVALGQTRIAVSYDGRLTATVPVTVTAQ